MRFHFISLSMCQQKTDSKHQQQLKLQPRSLLGMLTIGSLPSEHLTTRLPNGGGVVNDMDLIQ